MYWAGACVGRLLFVVDFSLVFMELAEDSVPPCVPVLDVLEQELNGAAELG
jgi:hypothetical protein